MDVQQLLSKVAENASVHRAFGPAYEAGGTLVIPVAWVVGGGGGGVDRAADRIDITDAADTADTASPAAGGGFGQLVWPLGVYQVRDGQVRWVPAVDVTRLALGAMALVRMVGARRCARRGRRG